MGANKSVVRVIIREAAPTVRNDVLWRGMFEAVICEMGDLPPIVQVSGDLPAMFDLSGFERAILPETIGCHINEMPDGHRLSGAITIEDEDEVPRFIVEWDARDCLKIAPWLE